MKSDLMNDLYTTERQFSEDLGNVFSNDGLELPGCLKEAILVLLRGGDENGILPYTERLENAAATLAAPTFGPAGINTFPFDEPTTRVFPEFLGVCAGKTKLNSALMAIKRYGEKARKNLPQDQPKTVILFTDKWDGPMFKKDFELAFLRYALENSILFIFLLVTDYGVSRIPFLARNHRDLAYLREKGYSIEGKPLGDTAMRCLKEFSPCSYECHGGTWAPYDNLYYQFDFSSMRCSIDGSGLERQIKIIPKAAAQKFAAAVYEFRNLPDRSYIDQRWVMDAEYCRAKVFDVRFEWHGNGTDDLDQPYQNVARAFSSLIAALKEM